MQNQILTNIICFYSKFSKHSQTLLDIAKTYKEFDNIQYISIDSSEIRNIIKHDKTYTMSTVPCLFLIYGKNYIEKYEGADASKWINEVINNINPKKNNSLHNTTLMQMAQPSQSIQMAQPVQQPMQMAQPVQQQPMQMAQPSQPQPIQMAQPSQPQPIQMTQPLQQQPMQMAQPPQQPMQMAQPHQQQPMQMAQSLQQQPMQMAQPHQQQPMQMAQPPQQQPMQMAQPPQQQPMQMAQPPQQQPMQMAQPPQQQPMQMAQPPQQEPVQMAAPQQEQAHNQSEHKSYNKLTRASQHMEHIMHSAELAKQADDRRQKELLRDKNIMAASDEKRNQDLGMGRDMNQDMNQI